MAVVSCSILLIIFFSGNEISAKDIYTNVWAVKVRGSQQEAEELAIKYGFSYDEHVGLSLEMRFSAFGRPLKLVKHFVNFMKVTGTHFNSLQISTLSYLLVYYICRLG